MANYLWERDGSRKYLTDKERERFYKEALKSKHRAFFLFLFYTGCRITEALRVRPCDFDDDGPELRSVVIPTLKQRQNGVFRTVPLLDDYWDILIADKVLDGPPAVRVWKRTRQWGWYQVKRVAKAAKVKGEKASCPKALRHTMGTHAVNNDVPMAVIQEVLGHTNPASTQVYAKVGLATVRRHQIWK